MTVPRTAPGRALLVCAALAFGQPLAHAQMPGGHPPAMGQPGRHGGRMQHMEQSLDLTPKQQAKVQAIIQSQRPAMKAVFSSATLSMPQKMQKLHAIQQGMLVKVNAILTPAQRQKFAAMRAQMAMRHAGMGGPGGPPHEQP